MSYRIFLEKEVPMLLEKLDAERKPLWGIMTAQVMVEHLGPALISATQEKEVVVSTPEDRLKKIREMILSDAPFEKNIKSSSGTATLPPLRFESMTVAKEKLVSALQKFYDYFDKNPSSITTHAYFGSFSFKEWETFQYKHFQHHFKQFGLIPE